MSPDRDKLVNPPTPAPMQIIDLFEALKRSLQQDQQPLYARDRESWLSVGPQGAD